VRKSSLPTLFLDRDGTLVVEKNYMKDPAQVRLLSGVADGLRRLRKAGFRVVVISNQAGVGRGLITVAELHAVNKRFRSVLRKNKAPIDGYYWCAHAPDDGCSCRKPKAGLLKRASRELGLSWKRSISVGDRSSDIELSQRVGGWGVLMLTGHGQQSRRKGLTARPDYVAARFSHFVSWVLRHKRKDGTWTISEN